APIGNRLYRRLVTGARSRVAALSRVPLGDTADFQSALRWYWQDTRLLHRALLALDFISRRRIKLDYFPVNAGCRKPLPIWVQLKAEQPGSVIRKGRQQASCGRVPDVDLA